MAHRLKFMDSSEVGVPRPEVALVAITRVALGFGAGLLLAPRLDRQARTTAGLALLAFGIATTGPLLVEVFGGRCSPEDTAGA